MRNLSLVSKYSEKHVTAGTTGGAISFDLDEKALILSCEILEPEPSIRLYKVVDSEEQKIEIATYEPTIPIINHSTHLVLSIKVVAESHSLVLILRNGEIATLSLDNLDESNNKFETVGEVDVGLKAASWSPDESLLVLITGEDNVILMTPSFDTISERSMCTTEEGEEKSINVGWGSKATQFHGSLGKKAAKEGSLPAHNMGSSPDDDGQPRISWKGDGTTFVISSLESSTNSDIAPSPSQSPSTTKTRRVLRYYSQTLTYLHPAEAIAGLEHALSWRPSGNLVASTQRFSPSIPGLGRGREGRHDVVFFEPNGLRHGEFVLRVDRWLDAEGMKEGNWGYRIKELIWNADSTILTVWIEVKESDGSSYDIIQLWTTSNYHWFLKQEFQSNKGERFSCVIWHPEEAMKLVTLSSSNELVQYTYIWDTCISRAPPPQDGAHVCVIDGSNLNITPFRLQNVPPPMCTQPLLLPKDRGPPISTCFSDIDDAIVALWEDGYLQLTSLGTIFDKGKEKPLSPRLLWEGHAYVEGKWSCKQVHLVKSHEKEPGWVIFVLGVHMSGRDFSWTRSESWDEVTCIHVDESGGKEYKWLGSVQYDSDRSNGSLIGSTDGTNGLRCYRQGPDGFIWGKVNPEPTSDLSSNERPTFSVSLYRAEMYDGIFFGLSLSGNIYITASGKPPRLLTSKASSFIITLGTLVYTTTTHQAFFAPISSLHVLLDDPESAIPEWEQRRVERGSRIVTAVDSNMSLVLQMPRGNLETIYPRPLVVRHIQKSIDAKNYRDAFLNCRKHRIDLNLVVNHDHESFMKNIPTFLDQVHEVDHINLFLAGIGRAKQEPEEISLICDAIRAELEKKDLKKYVNSILTTHVVKTPPDYENALSLLLCLHKEDQSLVENAVKYIIFLADADLLFDTALGMYDFSLVLMIAQQSQKDPREYLPFLRGLRSLEPNYQRFKIDDHLKRYKKALDHLHLTGDEHFEEAKSFIEKHRMYVDALKVWKGNSQKLKELYDLYGDYLFERREFEEAALAFRKAARLPKASIAYERALQWREVFEIAHILQTSEDDLDNLASRIADGLASKHHYADAAQVAIEYLEDIESAIRYLSEGALFSEAKRLASRQSRFDLTKEIITPAILNTRVSMSEELEEIKEQFEKQRLRIRALRERREAEPDAFYGIEENLHNVDMMTDVSTAFTAFTRYTVAPSTVSRGTSKRSQKLKRRSERKAGKKGTIEEEEYLLTSITKLAGRFKTMQEDCRHLLPHLAILEDHPSEAEDLQAELLKFETEFSRGIEEIWTPGSKEEDPAGEGVLKPPTVMEHKVDPRKIHPKPEVGSQWKYTLLSSID